MTPEDRQRFLMETENSVRQFAALIASRMSGSTGIPKPPEIIVTETETETERFGLKLDPKDESTSSSPGAPSTTPPETCAASITATIDTITLDAGCWSDVSLDTGPKTYDLFCACSPDCTGLGCTWDIVGTLGAVHYSCGPVTDYNIDVLIAHIAGVWYVFAYTLGAPFSPGVGVIFYGHASSIASPIANEGVYGVTALDTPLLDQVFGDCSPSSGAGSFHIVGSGGQITIVA